MSRRRSNWKRKGERVLLFVFESIYIANGVPYLLQSAVLRLVALLALAVVTVLVVAMMIGGR